jgi:hypothetical protein
VLLCSFEAFDPPAFCRDGFLSGSEGGGGGGVGGVLDDSIGKNTFTLIVKTKDDVSNKTKYAEEHSIPIMTPPEFYEKYLSR